MDRYHVYDVLVHQGPDTSSTRYSIWAHPWTWQKVLPPNLTNAFSFWLQIMDTSTHGDEMLVRTTL